MSTRSIALANQKGGVGKTTTAVSLAACLAERGKRTLLVDIDPQSNATSALGLEKLTGGSVYKALLGGAQLADSIRPSGYDNLEMIPSEIDLAVAEVDVARAENYLQRLQFALTPIQTADRYDFIIVDCPPSLGILTMNALAAVDSVLVPLQAEYFALEGLAVITRVLQQVRDSGANPGLELEGIVMTMYDARTNLAQQVAAEVRKHFPDKVFKTVIPRTVRLAEAPSFGKPITVYDPNSYAANCYRSLTDELLAEKAPVVAPAALIAPPESSPAVATPSG
ncbi:MAG TPA: ParA family protein [Verrucomicrobiae bacterium]|nr:ParA family protein [Verrucomicrobiae bacterium]